MKPLSHEVENLEGSNNCEIMKQEPFVIIDNQNLKTVIDILKSRLPRSSHIYSMALLSSRFLSIKVYSRNGDLSENAILLLIDIRQDMHQEINISVPVTFQISEDVKEDFISTTIIDWNSMYWCPALDSLISPLIFEISTFHKKNSTTVNPIYYYIMNEKDASNLEFTVPPGVEIKSLDNEGAEFIAKAWQFSRPGTTEYVKEVIEKGNTAGVYIEGKPVCGLIQYKNGYVGMLFTAINHRKKGYAILCMQFLMKQLGKCGFAIASAVECHNVPSNEFHKKIGMTLSHYCEDVIFEKGD